MNNVSAWIGIARVSLLIPSSTNLKERRSVVRSLLEQATGKFNASVADLGPQDLHQRAELAVACVGSSPRELEERLTHIRLFFDKSESSGEFEITGFNDEVFNYDDISD